MTLKGNKVSEPTRDDLADEIAAMANTADSVLVLGVDDKTRDIVGIPQEALDAVERLVFEGCCDSIRPPVAFRTLRLELPDSIGTPRAVMKVDVPRSLFVHESPGGYFQRQGSSKRPSGRLRLPRRLPCPLDSNGPWTSLWPPNQAAPISRGA